MEQSTQLQGTVFSGNFLTLTSDPASPLGARERASRDSDCYQQFLENLSQAHPNTLIILQVDNGRPHTAKKLEIPDNIILLFQPPYSPELNPIERLWQALKQDLKWELFSNLDELHYFLDRALKKLTPECIASICGYSFILDALSVANIY